MDLKRIETIEGVSIFPLKQFYDEKGSVYRGIRKSEDHFTEFGEAYFSIINFDKIKGWKFHQLMTQNFIVPYGIVEIIIVDKRPNSKTRNCFMKIIVSPNKNFLRLNIPPNLWYSFKSLHAPHSILLNVADMIHDPDESINVDIENDDWHKLWGFD